MSEEIWMDIQNYKGYYQISNLGRVRSLNRYVVSNKNGGRRLLKSQIIKTVPVKGRDDSDNKYLVVNLRKQHKNEVCLVHRLVALHFISNPDNLPTINHKDGNKRNNNLNNLEWATYSENNLHALETGLRKSRGISVLQYDLDGNLIAKFISASEAARKTGYGRGSICHCLNERIKEYKGFIWKYANTERLNDYPVGEYSG